MSPTTMSPTTAAPSTQTPTTPCGVCGCGVAVTDTDMDGTPDCNDGCPNDKDKIAAGKTCLLAPRLFPNAAHTFLLAVRAISVSERSFCLLSFARRPVRPCFFIDVGVCGCGNPETDSDGDGTQDCIDDYHGSPPWHHNMYCDSVNDGPGVTATLDTCKDQCSGDSTCFGVTMKETRTCSDEPFPEDAKNGYTCAQRASWHGGPCSDVPHQVDADNGYTCAQRKQWEPSTGCRSWLNNHCFQSCWNCNPPGQTAAPKQQAAPIGTTEVKCWMCHKTTTGTGAGYMTYWHQGRSPGRKATALQAVNSLLLGNRTRTQLPKNSTFLQKPRGAVTDRS
eukprot:gene27400-biopygen107991